MRECLTVLIGQAGLQIGDINWDIYCKEHGISNKDGTKLESYQENQVLTTLFNESEYEPEHFVPRSVMVDFEPSVVDSIFAGSKKDLYARDMTITGQEDAANNFARGYYTLSSKILDETIDIIRSSLELCDSFQALLMYSSFGGGTGSGFSARLIETLGKYFSGANRIEFNVFPSPKMSTAIVEPYNAVFRAHTSMSDSKCMFLFDNEACYRICQRHLDVQGASYYHINQLISQVASSITASTRFSGPLNVDLVEYETNLVPFPRMHFPSASFAPVLRRHKSTCANLSTKVLTRRCFDPKNQMLDYDPRNGKYMSCCLLYRGEVTLKDANMAVNEIRTAKHREPIEFVNWAQTGMKSGIASKPPSMLDEMADVNRALCLLSNNTSIGNCWGLLLKKFDLMFNRRAFVHWYCSEGMEEAEFIQAKDDVTTLINDYNGVDSTEIISNGN